jgi:hypothetical protein
MEQSTVATRCTLIVAAVAALAPAVLWVAGLDWWDEPLPLTSTSILMLLGGLQGLAWYWVIRRWMAWSGVLADEAKPYSSGSVVKSSG